MFIKYYFVNAYFFQRSRGIFDIFFTNCKSKSRLRCVDTKINTCIVLKPIDFLVIYNLKIYVLSCNSLFYNSTCTNYTNDYWKNLSSSYML